MKVYELKEILDRPEINQQQEVYYDDSNFTGKYHTKPKKDDFVIDEKGALIIKFPFETPVEF